MAKKIKFFNKEFKDKTNKQLIDEVLGINQMIDDIGCFGAKDCILREQIDSELYKRGYNSRNVIEYYKMNED